MSRLRVGLVALHMNSYFAEEYGVFVRAQQGLSQLAADNEFEVVVAPDHVVTTEDAAAATGLFAGQRLDCLVVLLATCTTSDPILELGRLGVPLLLWAVPEPRFDGPVQLNSYVALQIAASTLHRHNDTSTTSPVRYECLFGDVTEPRFSEPFLIIVRTVRVWRTLASSRVGLVGDVAPGFLNLNYDAAELRSRLGVEIVRHDVSVLLHNEYSSKDVDRVAAAMCRAAREVNVPAASVTASAVVYLNLRRLVVEHGYRALAVRDWPELQSLAHLSPLLAMAWLSEQDGIPVACEGDALGAVSLLALQAASGSMSTLLDIGPASPRGTELLVWHLGSSPHGFANDLGVTYEPHSTLGRKGDGPFGVVVDQQFASGRVTLINFSDGGKTLFVAGGRLVDGELPGPSGDRGWLIEAELRGSPVSIQTLLDTSLRRGLSHHCALVRGDWQVEMSTLGSWLGLDDVEPQGRRLGSHVSE